MVSSAAELDRFTFLSYLDVDLFDGGSASFSGSQHSIRTLDRIVGSLENDYALITERVVMGKRIWESNLYVQVVANLPIAPVSTNCGVMSKLVELLSFYKFFDDDSVMVLKQLRETTEASAIRRLLPNQYITAAELGDTLGTQSSQTGILKD